MVHRSERIAALVGEIYEAGLDPRRWDAALTAACDEIGAIGGILGYYQPAVSRGHTASCVRLDPELLELYHARYVDNVWSRSIARYVIGRNAVFADRYVPLRELRKTEFYSDLLAPQGIVTAMVVNFLGDDRGVGGMSFMYGKVAAAVPNDTLEVADFLSSHVRRAVGLSDRLNGATIRRQVAEEAIDQLRRGVLTLDDNGAIRFMNAAARQMIAARDGLTAYKGRLHAGNPASNRELGALIARTLQLRNGALVRAGGVLMIPRPSGRRPYLLTIVPFRSETLWPPATRPAALCFITDPQAEQRISAELLAQLFGFTPTETRIALEIADGRMLPQAAVACGIRLTTARTHLQGIFDKAGVRSQGRLAQLITQLVHGLPIEERS